MIVRIDYTNWRGERANRLIRPLFMTFSQNEWHKEPQWLLYATDLQKNLPRWFSMRNIHSWTETTPEQINTADAGR